MEKQLQVWALKKNIKPVMLDTLAAMYVTCNMFLMHCFDFSKSNNDLSFQKIHFFKTKIIKIRVFVFFIVMLEHFLEYVFL